MSERVILHSDINCCYASIEHLHHPELAGKPLAVGGDPEARHGIVLTADYIAKKYGVKTGMALWQAKQVCPDITFVSPRMDLYLRFSRMAHEIYAEYTDRQEPYGIDECWLDVTGSSSLKGDGLLIAQEISRRMKSELGITVSVGVSFNKIFAYVRITKTGGVAKTKDINEARIYITTEKAKERLLKAPGKTNGYYIQDVETNAKYKFSRSKGRINFPKEVRELIYDTAKGRCALCGRKITYDKMTLDHIVPLAMNGADDVSNFQCTCEAYNLFKGSVLPDDFMERITKIFLYQMDQKEGKRLLWKIVHKILNKMI